MWLFFGGGGDTTEAYAQHSSPFGREGLSNIKAFMIVFFFLILNLCCTFFSLLSFVYVNSLIWIWYLHFHNRSLPFLIFSLIHSGKTFYPSTEIHVISELLGEKMVGYTYKSRFACFSLLIILVGSWLALTKTISRPDHCVYNIQ